MELRQGQEQRRRRQPQAFRHRRGRRRALSVSGEAVRLRPGARDGGGRLDPEGLQGLPGQEGSPRSEIAGEAASPGARLPGAEAGRHDAAPAAGAHEAAGLLAGPQEPLLPEVHRAGVEDVGAGGAPPEAVGGRRRGRPQPPDRGDGHVPAAVPVVPDRGPVRGRRPAVAARLLLQAAVAAAAAGAGAAAAQDDAEHAPPSGHRARRLAGERPALVRGRAGVEQPAVHGGDGLVRGEGPVPECAEAAARQQQPCRRGAGPGARRVEEGGAAVAGQLELQELGGVQPRGGLLRDERRGDQGLLPRPALVMIVRRAANPGGKAINTISVYIVSTTII